MNKVILVTVTFNSSEYLKRLIDSAVRQTYPIYKIIVVDNNSNYNHKNEIKKILDNNRDIVDMIWLDENTGGAGGFSVGMKYMLEHYNADWMWIMDDDAYPKENCLEKLLEDAKHVNDIGFISPLIYGIENRKYQLYHHKIFGNNLIESSRAFKSENDICEITEIEANAFVGPLFPVSVVKEVGIAKAGLFIYGDDTEYTYRITRKYKGYVTSNAIIYHRDPGMSGNNHSNPKAWWKDYYEIRNSLLFVTEFSNSKFETYKYELVIIEKTIKKIVKAIIKKEYKNYRWTRIKLLCCGLVDGIKGNEGKSIDPEKYIKSLKC